MFVAEQLGKYVDELLDTMSIDELALWIAWFSLKAKEEEKAARRARAKQQGKRVTYK